MRKILLSALLLFGFMVASAGADNLLSIDGRETIRDDPNRSGCRNCFSTGRAREHLLDLKRDKSYGLPKAALPQDAVDTITVLAVRVDFAFEDPDDPSTTGRGRFDLRDTAAFLAEEGHALDPAPHNKHYFEAHLRSLAQYWWVTSNGRLQLVYEVWPRESDSAYHLDETIAHYGAQEPAFGLGEFFHDALIAAYAADGDSMSFRDERGKKKAVMLFHAGADRQTDLWFSATPTPNDLFTGFATFDAANHVVLGNDTIVEGVIMPETMTQDNRVTTMNAVMAHEFGHQLGLIDLYNTGSFPFLTQMGDFALMDNMGMNVAAYIGEYGVGAFGTVPVFPMAWSRAYLGFDEVVEYREGTSIELAAVKMLTSNTKIVKIPISSTEYYLLENRRTDLDGDVGLRQDSLSNVILWPARYDPLGDSIVALREYDVYLPLGSSGIAVWHIDEAVAAMDYFPYDDFENNFDANTLQWDPNRRFVRLVEADGLIDFGGNYHRGFGTPQDLFYAGNNSAFGTYTNPPTINNDGGYTHYTLTDISQPGMIMTFDLDRDRMITGFPRRVSVPDDPTLSPIAADLDRDGDDEIIAVSGRRILAVRADGKSFIDPDGNFDTDPRNIDTIYSAIQSTTDVNSSKPVDTSFAVMPVFAQVPGSITSPPVVATFDDSVTLVMVGNNIGFVLSYLPSDTNSDGRAELFAARTNQAVGPVAAVVPDTALHIIHSFHEDGGLISASWDAVGAIEDITYDFGGSFAGVCRWSGGMAAIHERGDGRFVLHLIRKSPFAVIDSFPIPDQGLHPPVATDFDRDGIDEVAVVSRSGLIRVFKVSMDGIEPFNTMYRIQTGDTAAAAPAVGDFSGDGFPELIVPGVNRLHAYDRTGLSATDFPMTVDYGRPGQLIITRPIVSDIDGDGSPDISVATFDSIPRHRTINAFYVVYPDSVNFPDSFIVVDTVVSYSFFNYYSTVHVLTPGRSHIDGFPVPSGVFGMPGPGDTVVGMATVLHVRDGERGILVTTGADGWLTGWRTGWSAGRALWPMAGATADGGSYLPLDVIGSERALSEFLPADRFFNYPNPASGNRTTIRFYVNQPAAVTVTIFDALGDKVWERQRRVPDGNAIAELDWDISDVASGVYHCRLAAEALTGSESEVAFKTIAVVK